MPYCTTKEIGWTAKAAEPSDNLFAGIANCHSISDDLKKYGLILFPKKKIALFNAALSLEEMRKLWTKEIKSIRNM